MFKQVSTRSVLIQSCSLQIHLEIGFDGENLIPKQSVLCLMKKDNSGEKSHPDLSDVRLAYDRYIALETQGKTKRIQGILGIIILLIGLFLEVLVVFNWDPSTCAAVEVPAFFSCGSNGIFILMCIFFSLPFLVVSEKSALKHKKWKKKLLLNLAKVSHFPSKSAKLKKGREERILSHVESLLEEEE